MEILIPTRFYGFDSVTYTVAAVIGFLVSYYAFKMYSATSKRTHKYLYLSFTLLSMGLLVLSVASWYNYFNYEIYHGKYLLDQYVAMDDFAYWIYYLCSILGYLLLASMYFPEKGFPLLFLPVWSSGFPYFNVLSLFILSYAIFRSVANFFSKKNMNSFLVAASFSLIGLYHLLLVFTSFSRFIYVIAHVCLGLGFFSLLVMLAKVSRK